MKRLEQIVFFTLLATIPIQTGKHFWPIFSFVQGIRVDYLSPTIYLTDILFVILFCVSIIRLKGKIFELFLSPLFLFTFAVLIAGLLFSIESLSVLYAIAKFLEFTYLGWYVYKTFENKMLKEWIFVFALGGLVETVIALFQFVAQRSIGGAFYFLGERTFSASTPGIAAFDWNGMLILRPYGTFPHPNVLAFYFLFCASLLLFVPFSRQYLYKIVRTIALVALSFGILLTFSRIIIILLPLMFGIFLYRKDRQKKYLYAAFFSGTMLLLVIGRQGHVFGDLVLRLELLREGAVIFLNYPILGVGLNNFYYHEIVFQKVISPILLQPIHNIYALWIVHTGVLGAITLIFFFKKIISKKSELLFSFLVVAVVVVGVFDHYFLTLQQGGLMLAITLGLYFHKPMELELVTRDEHRSYRKSLLVDQ